MAKTCAYGFDPNMCWVGFMPNWADTVRVSTCGTVLSILVDGRSLFDAFVAQEVLELETATPEIVISEWEKVDTKGMKKLINDHKVKVVCAVCPPLSALFVPAGWIWTDISTNGAVLICIRKSFFLNAPAHKDSYAWLEDIFKRGSTKQCADRLKDIAKMIG